MNLGQIYGTGYEALFTGISAVIIAQVLKFFVQSFLLYDKEKFMKGIELCFKFIDVLIVNLWDKIVWLKSMKRIVRTIR